jgi:AcrR family transcriptional regulator
MNIHHPDRVSDNRAPATSPFGSVRPRPGGRSARIQTAVFEAALCLLEEKGYEALSFASIASCSGVHEATLYRRWKTKEQLIIDAITSRVAQDISVPDTGTLRSDLIEILQSLRIFLQSALGQAIVQAAVATVHSPELCAFRRDYWHHRRAHLQILFDRAIVRGEFPSQADPQLFLETLICVLYVRLLIVNEVGDEGLSERIVDLVLPGVEKGLSTE